MSACGFYYSMKFLDDEKRRKLKAKVLADPQPLGLILELIGWLGVLRTLWWLAQKIRKHSARVVSKFMNSLGDEYAIQGIVLSEKEVSYVPFPNHSPLLAGSNGAFCAPSIADITVGVKAVYRECLRNELTLGKEVLVSTRKGAEYMWIDKENNIENFVEFPGDFLFYLISRRYRRETREYRARARKVFDSLH